MVLLRRAARPVLFVFAVLLVLVVVRPAPIAALQPSQPEDKFRSGGEVTIGADETIPHDMYVSGGRVRIEGTIDGDLVVAGGDVELSGPVRGDLWAAGGTVTVRSDVAGDIRAAGGTVRIEGQAGEDALVAAGSFTLAGAARVGQDLVFGAGETAVNGTIAGNVRGSTDSYRRGGTIQGVEDVSVDVGEDPSVADRVWAAARRYAAIVLIGILALLLAPRALRLTAATLDDKPLPSALAGLIAMVGYVLVMLGLLIALVLLVIVFALLTLGNLVLTSVVGVLLGGGLLTYLVILAAVYLAAVVVGLALGRLALPQARTGDLGWSIAALLLGVLVVVVLTEIPRVGGLLNFLVILFGLGAIALAIWQRRNTMERAAV